MSDAILNPMRRVVELLTGPLSVLQVKFYSSPFEAGRLFQEAEAIVMSKVPEVGKILDRPVDEAAEHAHAAAVVLLRPVIRFVGSRRAPRRTFSAMPTPMPIWMISRASKPEGQDSFSTTTKIRSDEPEAEIEPEIDLTSWGNPAASVEAELIRKWARMLVERFDFRPADEAALLRGLVRDYREHSPYGPAEP